MSTLPTLQSIHQSEFNYLSQEQFGVFKLFLHFVQLFIVVHSSQGHF